MSKYVIDDRKIPLNKMLRYDAEQTKLEDPFLGVRAMAFDVFLYKGMREHLRKILGSGAATILYEIGVGYGEIMGGMIEERGKYDIGVYKDFLERGNYHGMGHFSVPVLEEVISSLKGEAKVRLRESFFAEASGKTGECECYIFAGFIAGAAGRLFGRKFSCIEDKCVSKHDEYCEFILKPIKKSR